MKELIDEIIDRLTLFSGADHDTVFKIIGTCEVKKYSKGDTVCNEDEYSDVCSIIVSGTVNVDIGLDDDDNHGGIVLGEGEIIGEIAVLSGNPRTAKVEALCDVRMLDIPKKNLLKLIDKVPTFKKGLDNLYRDRALKTHLMKCHIFSGIRGDVLEELAKKVTLHTYNKDDIIFNQDDDSDAFYLIRYGFVRVMVYDGHKEKVLAYLKDGHFFGEMGLLKSGQKRMATLSAINRAEVIRISNEDFKELTDAYPSVALNLEKIVERRLQKNIKISSDSFLERTLDSLIEHGVIQSKAVLILDVSKCVQCDNCVKSCAALHGGVSRLVRKGTTFSNVLLLPTSCRHCDDPTCMSKCPTGAITRDAKGEIYHKDNCIGCGSCAKLCPYGNISVTTIEDDLNDGFLSKLFGSLTIKSSKDGKDSPTPGSVRFSFPGDRDMVERDASSRLPGDRDLVEPPVAEGGKGAKKKKKARKKAVKCDMCREYDVMGCVYNCPRGAARRVDPTEFFTDLMTIN